MSIYCINDKLLFDSNQANQKAPVLTGLYQQLVNTNQSLEKQNLNLRELIANLTRENKELRDKLTEKEETKTRLNEK